MSVRYVGDIVVDDGLRNDAIIFNVDNAIRITGLTFPGDRIYPLANPLNEPVSSMTSSDCLDGVSLDEYIPRSDDGAFHVSVVTGGSVLICYLFEGESRPMLTSFNLLVLGVINPTVTVEQDGEVELTDLENLWAVKNVTSRLSFESSDSVHEARYKWIPGDAADCSAEGVGLDYDEEGSRALLYDAESNRMYDDFALTNVTTENWKLCYQFSGKRWVVLSEQSQGDVYPPITMESRALLDIQSVDESDPFELVPRVEKQWMVEVANGKENDKMRLVTGVSCTRRQEIVATADVQGYLVTWSIDEDGFALMSTVDRMSVCYGFTNGASNFWVRYDEFATDVVFVNEVVTTGNKNLAYVNQTKEYTLRGANVDRAEDIYFVAVSEGCESEDRYAPALVVDGKAVTMFTSGVESRLKMCVHFSGQLAVSVMPNNENILEVSVVEVVALQSTEGYSSDASVVSQSKNFRLIGTHPELVRSVIFSTSTCDSVFASFDVAEGAFVGHFEQHSEGAPLTLCVKYDGEEPIDTEISMTLKSLTSIGVSSGDSRVLMWGTSKTFTFSGYGLNSEEDTAEFVLASSVRNDN